MDGYAPKTDFRSLLHRVFAENGKTPHLLLNLLKDNWPAIVGDGLALRCTPNRLERGTLWVAATDACWAYEMQFHKSDLMRSVRAFIESDTIQEIRFRSMLTSPGSTPVQNQPNAAVKELPNVEKGDPRARKLRRNLANSRLAEATPVAGEPTRPHNRQSAPQGAEHIADPALQAVFSRTKNFARERLKPRN